MYSGHIPFGQSVMNEEQIFNAAVSFKNCTQALSNAFEFGAASYYLKVSKIAEQPFIRSYHIQAKNMLPFQYMILSPAILKKLRLKCEVYSCGYMVLILCSVLSIIKCVYIFECFKIEFVSEFNYFI